MDQISFSPIFENHLNFYWLLLFVMFLFQTVDHVNGQTLIYNTQFTSQDGDINNKLDWMLFDCSQLLDDQQVVGCDNKKVFGGISNNVNMVMFKTFFLPPHYAFQLNFLIYDSCFYDFSITLYVDDQSINSIPPLLICYTYIDCNFYRIDTFAYDNYHFSPTLQIQIIQYSDMPDSFWGITDFALSIFQCPQQCDSCNLNGECDKWTQISIYFGEQDVLQIEGWLKNNEPFGGIMSCGNFSFYGFFVGADVIKFNSIISKDHTEIRIRFKTIAVQHEEPELVLQVNVNNQEQTFSNALILNERNLICGNFQTIIAINGIFQHNVPNLLISIIKLLLEFQIIILI